MFCIKNWNTEILPKSNQFMKNGFLSRSFLFVIIWDPRRCWFKFIVLLLMKTKVLWKHVNNVVLSAETRMIFFQHIRLTGTFLRFWGFLLTQFAHFLSYWYHNSKTAYDTITSKLVLHNTVFFKQHICPFT